MRQLRLLDAVAASGMAAPELLSGAAASSSNGCAGALVMMLSSISADVETA